MARMPVQFRLNGSDRAVFVEPAETLLGTIRRGLGDFAPKFGCGQGTCGVCTVLVDGEPRLGCLTLSVTCEGRSIETASGLADGPTLHPLQAAFIDHDAFQCGYCTPGQICSAVGLIAEGHAKSADEIRELMSGNVCRCGCYPNIVAAIEEVMQGASPGSSS